MVPSIRVSFTLIGFLSKLLMYYYSCTRNCFANSCERFDVLIMENAFVKPFYKSFYGQTIDQWTVKINTFWLRVENDIFNVIQVRFVQILTANISFSSALN